MKLQPKINHQHIKSKKNILENYRREALISTLRKIEQRKKEREEDKFNLEQKQMRQNEMDEIINKEKRAKREKLKKEYKKSNEALSKDNSSKYEIQKEKYENQLKIKNETIKKLEEYINKQNKIGR